MMSKLVLKIFEVCVVITKCKIFFKQNLSLGLDVISDWLLPLAYVYDDLDGELIEGYPFIHDRWSSIIWLFFSLQIFKVKCQRYKDTSPPPCNCNIFKKYNTEMFVKI